MRALNSFAEAFAWLAAIVYSTIPAYWLAVHPFAAFWRNRKGKIYLFLGLIWLALWISAGLVTARYRHDRLWPAWSWLGWAIFFGFGIVSYRRIGHGFGRANLLGQAEVRPQEHEQKLVTTGMHARVRHPIYLAHLLMLTAWTVGAGTIAVLALWIFAILTGIFLIRSEDRELEGRFGDGYREYKKRVPAIIPR